MITPPGCTEEYLNTPIIFSLSFNTSNSFLSIFILEKWISSLIQFFKSRLEEYQLIRLVTSLISSFDNPYTFPTSRIEDLGFKNT